MSPMLCSFSSSSGCCFYYLDSTIVCTSRSSFFDRLRSSCVLSKEVSPRSLISCDSWQDSLRTESILEEFCTSESYRMYRMSLSSPLNSSPRPPGISATNWCSSSAATFSLGKGDSFFYMPMILSKLPAKDRICTGLLNMEFSSKSWFSDGYNS